MHAELPTFVTTTVPAPAAVATADVTTTVPPVHAAMTCMLMMLTAALIAELLAMVIVSEEPDARAVDADVIFPVTAATLKVAVAALTVTAS